MNQSRGSNRPMVVRGNPVPFARQHAPTPSAEGPQPLQWPPAELATRGAAPGQASPAATSTPASCPHSKEVARRSPHRLTVTPGPCCRPRGSGALRDGVQEDRTMGNAPQHPARRESSSTNWWQWLQRWKPSERSQRKQDVLAPAAEGRKGAPEAAVPLAAPPTGWRPHSAQRAEGRCLGWVFPAPRRKAPG